MRIAELEAALSSTKARADQLAASVEFLEDENNRFKRGGDFSKYPICIM